MAGKKRKFSADFKKQVVNEVLSGTLTMAQATRQYELSSGLIQNWKEKFQAGLISDAPTPRERALEAKVADLEQMIGQQAVEIKLLKKAQTYVEQKRREASLPITAKTLKASSEAVN